MGEDAGEDGHLIDAAPTWTVDELAREVGTMTTTIRMYQAKGLLPAPSRRGRVAVYDRHHVDRLRLIAELQRRGHSLAGIGDLLAGFDRGTPLGELLGLGAWSTAEPLTLPAEELVARLGGATLDAAVIARAVELGVVRLDGTQAVVPDRRFVEIGSALVEIGVPAAVVLDEWVTLSSAMGDVADRFVALFDQHVVPAVEEASLADVTAVLDRLAALARSVVLVALDAALRSRAEEFARRPTDS